MIETLAQLELFVHQLEQSGIEFPDKMVIDLEVGFDLMKELNRYSLNRMVSVAPVITYTPSGSGLKFKLRQK